MTTQLSFGYLQQQQAAAIPRRRVCDLPTEERPLYRLHQVGSSALATSELLALVLGTADALDYRPTCLALSDRCTNWRRPARPN